MAITRLHAAVFELLFVQSHPDSTLVLGPASETETLNGFDGVRRDELGEVPTHQNDFKLSKILQSITRDASAEQPRLSAEQKRTLQSSLRSSRAEETLFDFQSCGIRWLLEKEGLADVQSLHAGWIQLKSKHGTLFYLHDWSGHLSMHFHTAPPRGTCGGMLCDDTGLGKTIQMLSLFASRRAPSDFASPVTEVHDIGFQPATPRCSLLSVRMSHG